MSNFPQIRSEGQQNFNFSQIQKKSSWGRGPQENFGLLPLLGTFFFDGSPKLAVAESLAKAASCLALGIHLRIFIKLYFSDLASPRHVFLLVILRKLPYSLKLGGIVFIYPTTRPTVLCILNVETVPDIRHTYKLYLEPIETQGCPSILH